LIPSVPAFAFAKAGVFCRDKLLPIKKGAATMKLKILVFDQRQVVRELLEFTDSGINQVAVAPPGQQRGRICRGPVVLRSFHHPADALLSMHGRP
jgi:hypothetical protein